MVEHEVKRINNRINDTLKESPFINDRLLLLSIHRLDNLASPLDWQVHTDEVLSFKLTNDLRESELIEYAYWNHPHLRYRRHQD